MYFTILAKKEITINVEVSAQKIADLICENIHNRKSIFEKDSEKPFSGEESVGTFSLDLNEPHGRISPFSRFSLTVLGDEESAQIRLLFKNDFYEPKELLFNIVLTALLSFFTRQRLLFLLLFPFLLIAYTISFNVKLNRCAEEVQYIADKAFLASSSL